MARHKRAAPPRRPRSATPRAATGRTPPPLLLEETGEVDRRIVEDAIDSIAVLTMEGIITKVNRGTEQLLGWSRQDLVGAHYRTVATDKTVEWLEERRRRVLAGERLPQRPYEIELRHKEGRTIRVEACTQVIRDATGAPLRFYGIFRDLSERREAEAMLQTVADTINAVIYVLSSEGKLRYLSTAFQAITGWLPEQWKDKDFLPIVHPDDQARAAQIFLSLLAGEPIEQNFEMRIQKSDGTYLIGEFNAIGRRANGEAEVIGIGRDITARKQMEAQLHESEALRARIIETMPEILCVYDVEAQRLLYVNQQVYAVLGYHPDEVAGLTPAQLQGLLPATEAPRVVQLYTDFIRATGPEVLVVEYPVQHKNGEWRWLQCRTTALKRTTAGRPQELLGMALDITERKRLEERLQQQAIQPKEMPARLRKFRERLRLTQPEFGQEFGGYQQRQISGYETGQVEIPLKLLLAIRAKGYPLDAILGSGPTAVLENTVMYFSTMYTERRLTQQLAAAVAELLQRDVSNIEQALRELNVPARDFDYREKQILEHLAEVRKAEDEG
jgi:PAS domain S-box-containing protein